METGIEGDRRYVAVAHSIYDSDLVSSSSIFVVPEGLKKSNEDAYMPRVVSIGPRFKGSRQDLLHMEHTKIQCMKHLISRNRGGQISDLEILIDFCREIEACLEFVRASYMVDINLGSDQLIKVLFVDYCFLLELLISKEFDAQLPSHRNVPSPAHELLRNEDVLSDLSLLENQIPIFLLSILSRILFPDFFSTDINNETPIRINNIFLSILGYCQLEVQDIRSPHILDIVHFYINGENERQSIIQSGRFEEEYHVVDINIDTQTQQQRVVKLKLKRCALRLLTAGVTIKAKYQEDKDSTDGFDLSCLSNLVWMWNCLCGVMFRLCNVLLVNGKHVDPIPEDVEVKGLDFYFKFEKGNLEINQLHITKTTKAKWCNLIAWEYHKKYNYSSRFIATYVDYEIRNTDAVVPGHRPGGKFTWAALIFNGLICSTHDVQLLKDRNIIVDHVMMTNQEMLEFFRTIAFGVDHRVVDSSAYIQMVDDINNYSHAFVIQRIWKTMVSSFRYRREWIIRFMNRNYNFVATMLFVLAIVQTVYTILAYYFPK